MKIRTTLKNEITLCDLSHIFKPDFLSWRPLKSGLVINILPSNFSVYFIIRDQNQSIVCQQIKSY
jgi:hypothetical protein